MYCLQYLQLRWPVKLGLMYCLQDLQLRWPVKALWRERCLLTGFKISAVTKLQDNDYWCSTGRHHTCRTPQCSCRPPCYVPSKSDCLWTVTDGQTTVKWSCCSVVLHLEDENRKLCEVDHCECDLRWIYKTQIIFSLNKEMIRMVCIILTGIWSTDLLSQLQTSNKITQIYYIYYNNFASSNLYKLHIFRSPHKALLIIFHLPLLILGQCTPNRFSANHNHISKSVPAFVSKVLVLVILSGTGGMGGNSK
jgi:hypothetical protein